MAKPNPIEGATVTFEDWRLAFNSLLAAAPEVVESAASDPAGTDDDYEVGSIWVRLDLNIAWILVHSTLGEGGAETNDAVWVQLGATPGALIDDGTVPLTAPWNAGAFAITAANFISSVAQGTAPFESLNSTTLCPNLNAALLGGLGSGAYLRTDGINPLSGNWDTGAFDITNVGGFTSEMITANSETTTRLNLSGIVAQFGSIIAQTDYSIGRQIATGTLILTGGASSGGGFNIKLFGSSHSTQANDVEFRAAGVIKLQWDHDVNGGQWDFKGQNIVNIGLFDGRDVAVDGTKLDLIADEANKYVHPAHTGDVTGSGVGNVELTIGDNKVTNAKMLDMPSYTIKMNDEATSTVKDQTILALTEEPNPVAGDYLLGQKVGNGPLRKFPADNFNKNAPALLRNPYKKHNTYGGYSSGTASIDCEQHQSAYLSLTGSLITIDLVFPAYSGDNRGTNDFALSGKVWVLNSSGTGSVNVTSNASINPFGGGGDGAKGVEPQAAGEWGCLVWEFFDDGTGNRFLWAEWINE